VLVTTIADPDSGYLASPRWPLAPPTERTMTIERKFKFSDTLIAKLETTGEVYRVWDTVTQYLGVTITANGVKSFFVQRRRPGHKHPKRMVIGRCSGMTVAKARIRAEEVLYKMGLGLDPRVPDIQSLTLREALERYLAKDKPQPLAEGSKVVIKYAILRWLATWLDLPLLSIDHDMVDERHGEIKAQIAADAKPVEPGRAPIDGKATANLVMEHLRAIWNYVLKKHNLGINPVIGLVRYTENNISRAVPRKSHAIFYDAVLEYFDYNPIIGGAILIALFTGFRRENVQELLWSEIGELFIEIPGHKVKNGETIRFPINSAIRWVFDEIDRICGRHSSGYVFPTQSFKSKSPHITNLSRKITEIGKDLGLVLSAHDLRHTYLGVCLQSKISWIATKRLAGHSLGKDDDITAAYQEADYTDDELVVEAETVYRYMARRCGLDMPEPLTAAEQRYRDEAVARAAELAAERAERAAERAERAADRDLIQRLTEELAAERADRGADRALIRELVAQREGQQHQRDMNHE
jgi:integrase